MDIHVVRPGDTVASIARQYEVSADLLIKNNMLDLRQGLVVGQTIVVLYPTLVHTVMPGDTLYSIARRYGVSVSRLWRNNIWLGGRSVISPGQSIVITYSDAPTRQIEAIGYIYPFVGIPLLRQTLPFIGILMPFTYGFTPEGTLVSLDDEQFISLAKEYGAKPYMHLSTLTENGTFSSESAEKLLSDMQFQQTVIESVMTTIEQKGYLGLDVDFEYIHGWLADDYVAFLTRLKARLSPKGLGLITAVAPKTRADERGLLYEGHDFDGIGKVSDGVLIMTYEWGYKYSSPRAVAPVYWVRSVLNYAVTAIPRDKIYMGIPNYGYDWPLPFVEGQTSAQSISNTEAVSLAARYGAEILYDERSQAPYFHYTAENGVRHEVWFEDARSMQAKFALVSEYRLLGGGYWNLMRPFPQNWLLQNALFGLNR